MKTLITLVFSLFALQGAAQEIECHFKRDNIDRLPVTEVYLRIPTGNIKEREIKTHCYPFLYIIDGVQVQYSAVEYVNSQQGITPLFSDQEKNAPYTEHHFYTPQKK